ncbi:MAG: hypothetical protein KGL39_29030 [Patescibacteria group bacterium]|nr:hypothetical protein [Patescibacteria group bacterium]
MSGNTSTNSTASFVTEMVATAQIVLSIIAKSATGSTGVDLTLAAALLAQVAPLIAAPTVDGLEKVIGGALGMLGNLVGKRDAQAIATAQALLGIAQACTQAIAQLQGTTPLDPAAVPPETGVA